eukprot:SAG11_NODE_2898_length_2851_cov_3.351381_3_plen_67_part_00
MDGTQGGCASRPGMCHPAIVGRRLDRPVINLGFSGNGRMEPVRESSERARMHNPRWPVGFWFCFEP